MKAVLVGYNIFVGAWCFIMGLLHIIFSVLKWYKEPEFTYDMRAYGILALGIGITLPGLAVALYSKALSSGELYAWQACIALSIFIVLMTLPALKFQFSIVPFMALINTVTLIWYYFSFMVSKS